MNTAIEVNNLTYAFPGGTVALKGISFIVNVGESVGIIGPNGAGKTTLLLSLNGVLGDKQDIKILGLPLNKKNIKEIRDKVGIVFQNPDDQLFMPTVFDDIAFGLFNLEISKIEIEKKVNNILDLFGLNGYKNRPSHHLSLGEKKRVALASVLVMNPEILLLDEPTSGLDPATRREFIEHIKNINCTKIIAGHDLKMISEICNKVILLNNGKKIIEGDTTEVIGNTQLLLQNRLV